jgi:hypothetical protein
MCCEGASLLALCIGASCSGEQQPGLYLLQEHHFVTVFFPSSDSVKLSIVGHCCPVSADPFWFAELGGL